MRAIVLFIVLFWELSIVLPAYAAAGGGLPTLGGESFLTPSEERLVGDKIMRGIFKDPAYLDDPILGAYIDSIWSPLLKAAAENGDLSEDIKAYFSQQVILIRSREVNAFALPGGYLGVHLGLINLVENADEIASVLAHELSHVTQRHISRLMSAQDKQTPLIFAGALLGVLVASKSPDATNALVVGGHAAGLQSQLNFSRDMEREADRIGFNLLAGAGFDQGSMATMLDKLDRASSLKDAGFYPYLRSHPLTTERIADIRQRLHFKGQQKSGESSKANSMMTARAGVLVEPGVDALQGKLRGAISAANKNYSTEINVGILYSGVMAASLLKEDEMSYVILERLLLSANGDAQARALGNLLGAEISLAQGRTLVAKRYLDDFVGSKQFLRPYLFLRAQVELEIKNFADLQDYSDRIYAWLIEHPKDSLAWEWLSRLEFALNHELRALRAQAESRAAILDAQGALDRLQAAQQWVRKKRSPLSPAESIDAAIIDSRAREIYSVVKLNALNDQVK